MVSRRPRKCRYSIPSQFCMALLKTLWTLKLVKTFHTEAEFVRRWASYWGKNTKFDTFRGRICIFPLALPNSGDITSDLSRRYDGAVFQHCRLERSGGLFRWLVWTLGTAVLSRSEPEIDAVSAIAENVSARQSKIAEASWRWVMSRDWQTAFSCQKHAFFCKQR